MLLLLALPAAAQNRGDFRWDKTLPAGNEVSINNINGDITVIPSTTGRVEVVGIKRGTGNLDRIKADVQQTSRGIIVCVLLGYLGAQPPEGIYVIAGRILTVREECQQLQHVGLR